MSQVPRDALVHALDVGGLPEATALVERLGEDVLWYKVGLELFSAAGPPAIEMLKARGKRVFLDLKLHDIPNTVTRAVHQLIGLGADVMDLHVAAGHDAMAQVAEAVRTTCPPETRPQLLGVTVLTSTALDAEGRPLGLDDLVAEVVRRAAMAQAAGLDGVVCPAPAATAVRDRCGAGFLTLVPGIRPAGAVTGDQRWIATPASALAAGARWIVVGRPISAAPDPVAAARDILAEMTRA